MPTSKSKNFLYSLLFPLLSPAVNICDYASADGKKPLNGEKLFSILNRYHISGAAVRLQTQEFYSDLFFRAVHTDTVPDGNTFFRVASITKMATALLSVRLMDMGILDPDAPLSELLPEGKKTEAIKGICFRHLLSHRSGLADPPDLEALLLRKEPYTVAVSGCRRFQQDTAFLYSNLGYGLIGCVFESLLGMNLESVFQEYLFRPLKMNATLEACSLPADRIMPVSRLFRYHPGNSIRITQLGRIPLRSPEPLYHYGHTAGSMYTDLASLNRLLTCIRDAGKPLLSSRYAGFMKQELSVYGKASPTLSYGSGLLVVRDPRISDSILFGHQGFAYGCVDGAFWEESTGNILISLNGGCSEARSGRFGTANRDLCAWAFRKELPEWR